MTIKQDIEALYAKVAADAIKDKVPLEERIEALKVLKPYYELLTKNAAKLPAEPSDGPTFGDFRADLKDVPLSNQGDRANGRTTLRGGRRN